MDLNVESLETRLMQDCWKCKEMSAHHPWSLYVKDKNMREESIYCYLCESCAHAFLGI